MLKIILLHLLILILIPILWHEYNKPPANTRSTSAAAAPVAPPESDQNYYEQIFSYTMQNTKDGESYSWQGSASSGTITVGPVFVSASHSNCRGYNETFQFNGKSGSSKGFGCQRMNDDTPPTWCKLHEHNALTCALEPPTEPLDLLIRGASDALSGVVPSITHHLH